MLVVFILDKYKVADEQQQQCNRLPIDKNSEGSSNEEKKLHLDRATAENNQKVCFCLFVCVCVDIYHTSFEKLEKKTINNIFIE